MATKSKSTGATMASTSTSSNGTTFLKFTSHRNLATRLVLATLTGRSIHISGIRSSSPTAPGLAPQEVTLLRLLESITNGSVIQISYTGTSLTYKPGLIVGCASSTDVIECRVPAACTRGVSFFLTALCTLAPFAKAAVNVRFSGPGVITAATEAGDVSVDTVRTALLPLAQHFAIPTVRLELRVLRRACASLRPKLAEAGEGGIVELRFAGQVRLPATLHLHRESGAVRRVRGVAYATGTSASNNGRLIFAARGILNKFIPDVQIAAQYDVAPPLATSTGSGKGGDDTKTVGRKPGIGFGLALVAESSSDGVFYSADVTAPPEGGVTPEDIGKQCALQLLETIALGGNASPIAAGMMLTLMTMGSEDVGRIRLGRDVLGTEKMIDLARDVRTFGGSSWGLRDADDETDIIVSVKGMGLGNVGRKIA